MASISLFNDPFSPKQVKFTLPEQYQKKSENRKTPSKEEKSASKKIEEINIYKNKAKQVNSVVNQEKALVKFRLEIKDNKARQEIKDNDARQEIKDNVFLEIDVNKKDWSTQKATKSSGKKTTSSNFDSADKGIIKKADRNPLSINNFASAEKESARECKFDLAGALKVHAFSACQGGHRVGSIDQSMKSVRNGSISDINISAFSCNSILRENILGSPGSVKNKAERHLGMMQTLNTIFFAKDSYASMKKNKKKI